MFYDLFYCVCCNVVSFSSDERFMTFAYQHVYIIQRKDVDFFYFLKIVKKLLKFKILNRDKKNDATWEFPMSDNK